MPREVTSTLPLRANTELVPSIHVDRSSEFLRPPSTNDISSSNHDPPSSNKIVPIVPALSLEASLNIPSRGNSPPSQPPPELVQDDLLSDSLEDSLTIPAHPHSTSPQRLPGITQDDSVPITLKVALAPASLTPSQEGSLNSKVSSTLAPRPSFALHPPHSPLSSSVNVNFEFTFVTLTTPVSALFFVSAIIPTRSCMFWRKNENIRNDRNGITIPGNAFNFTQLFQLVLYKPHAVRFGFDPGGSVSALAPRERLYHAKYIVSRLFYLIDCESARVFRSLLFSFFESINMRLGVQNPS
jgi:hypothetical protein